MKKLKDLETHYEDKRIFYESDLYELIGQPHPNDFDNSGKEIITAEQYKERVNKESKSARKIREQKSETIQQIKNYSAIVYTWLDLNSQHIQNIRNLIAAYNLEQAGSYQSKVIRDNSSYKLEPINSDDLYSGLPTLLKGLIELKIIAHETSLKDIRRLFGFGDGSVKIKCCERTKSALYHFIRELERSNKIKSLGKKKQKTETIRHLFVFIDDPDYNFDGFLSNNGTYSKLVELKNLINDL